MPLLRTGDLDLYHQVVGEGDLEALIERLGPAPAHVAGSSFGRSIALGLAARRPELFLSITVHEPPLVAIVADDPDALGQLRPTQASMDAVLAHLRKGEHRQGARQFVEEVAMGPGTWDRLPAAVRETFVHNAPTWLDEQSDPDWAKIDTDALARCAAPVLLGGGTRSPMWLATILDRLAAALPRARRGTVEGAGHIPHVTHPGRYADALTRFVRTS
ncbi:alpha/beta fold hydrolase [Streptomyces mirabilis]|uniref:alpha/beta fold hydrolase n=1 Tax=Streptomyces mirabilis TaxID=68239 RepID=UPI0036A523F9